MSHHHMGNFIYWSPCCPCIYPKLWYTHNSLHCASLRYLRPWSKTTQRFWTPWTRPYSKDFAGLHKFPVLNELTTRPGGGGCCRPKNEAIFILSIYNTQQDYFMDSTYSLHFPRRKAILCRFKHVLMQYTTNIFYGLHKLGFLNSTFWVLNSTKLLVSTLKIRPAIVFLPMCIGISLFLIPMCFFLPMVLIVIRYWDSGLWWCKGT